jgi:CheY-like chemotaxis protein
MVDNALRILIVDDDAMLRQLLTKAFTNVSFEVAVAADGAAAIQVFRTFKPDVVLMDIIMPEREGVETIVELRTLDPNVPIIAMSGGGRVGPTEFLALAEALGATATVKKPFTISQIRDVVQRALNAPNKEAVPA